MCDNLCWDDHLKLGCADATEQRAAWAEVERLQSALHADGCLKCQVDGYWYKACKLKEAEVERMQEIVGQLPKTADGVPWVPDCETELWRPEYAERQDDIESSEDGWLVLWFFRSAKDGSSTCYEFPVSDCYSTREAAEAAKEKEKKKDE